jgi:dephospho-CoA kinase
VLVVGLTGGIASGKSTVAERFAARGVAVIDTDVIAREVVEPGAPGLQRVVEAFGAEVLDADGRLARAKLAARVFRDAAARERLESILHPLIRAESERRIAQAPGPYCVLVVPLLVETGYTGLVDRVLVVDLPEAVQIERLQARDERPREEIEGILRAQASREERLAAADDVIRNDADLAALEHAIEALHRKYLRLAG